jgi:large subunit ribosomal protein L28
VIFFTNGFALYSPLKIFENFQIESTMSKVCILTGKKHQYGNTVSHANNHRRTRFEPNLQEKRIWLEGERRWVRVRLSTRAIKTLTKNGTHELEKLLASK